MRTIQVGLLVGLLATSVAHAGIDPALECLDAKLKATGKKAFSLLKCHAKAEKRGPTVDASCVLSASDKFDAAFARAEAKGACITLDDADILGKRNELKR